MQTFDTQAINEVQTIKGGIFPADVTFRQLLITGPPGCGKSTQVSKLGGWPEEGYIDLSSPRWWTAQTLSLRPREIHLGIPFQGVDEPLAVFDDGWLALDAPKIDFSRITLPPQKRYFFSVNWQERYVFEFLLPEPEVLYQRRMERGRQHTHPVDQQSLSLKIVTRQVLIYEQIALFFQRQGMSVYVREESDGVPLTIIDPET
ncbi:MAG: serine/threonine protein phosphatase [Chromatiales bacterium]|nr:serine/threonine protein phosphatase [Chromatiales bacterium]